MYVHTYILGGKIMILNEHEDRCDVTIFHNDIVDKVQKNQLPDEQVLELASLFQAITALRMNMY
jgi:hypothetical protein